MVKAKKVPIGTNSLATVSMVLGIVGFLTLVILVGFLLCIVALVLGIIALTQISKSAQRGKGMAIAGIVLGALGIVLLPALLVGIIAYFSVVKTGFIPPRCSMEGGFECSEYRVYDTAATTQVYARIVNNLGTDASNITVYFDSEDCVTGKPAQIDFLANDDERSMDFFCETALKSGDYLNGGFSISYTAQGEVKRTFGSLVAWVE